MNTRSLEKVLTAARSYQQWHDQSRSMRDCATGSPFFRQPSPLLSVITQAKGQQLGVWWRLQTPPRKSPELGAGLVQDELCGEAAAPTTPGLPHLNSRSWWFPPRQDTAVRPRVQQNAFWWRTISWPSLEFQLQASSPTRAKHNLSQFLSTGCTSLDYGSSQYISAGHVHIPEQSLSQTETGHQDWTNALSDPKQDNWIYKGYFPSLLSITSFSD